MYLSKPDVGDTYCGEHESIYSCSRRSADNWFVDNWGAVPGSKRERSVRITEILPVVKKRRQTCPRSPTKGRSDKRAKVSATPSSRLWFTNSEAQMREARDKAVALGNLSGRSDSPITGSWHPEEDELLRQAVTSLFEELLSGSGRVPWSVISLAVPGRNAKQCRERFVEHLDVNIDCTPIADEEAEFVCYLFGKHGRKWSKMCEDLNGWRFKQGYEKLRACSMVKNFITAKQCMFGSEDTVFKQNVPPTGGITPIEFFEGFPSSPTPEPIAFQEFADVVGFGCMPLGDDVVQSTDKEWEEMIKGFPVDSTMLFPHEHPRCGLVAEVGEATDVAKPVSKPFTIQCVQSPRACCAKRKIQMQLSDGLGSSNRSFFESINKMINTPRSVATISSFGAKRQSATTRRKSRAFTGDGFTFATVNSTGDFFPIRTSSE